MNTNKCRKCRAEKALSNEQITEMVKQVTAMKGVKLAEQSEYERRIEICRLCEYFFAGSTCRLCGCVMQVRARLSDGKCPFPGKSKWAKK